MPASSGGDIASLEPAVAVVRAKVAGPGALVVAKMFKIHERRGSAGANDKDALDVLRILQGISTEDLARDSEIALRSLV